MLHSLSLSLSRCNIALSATTVGALGIAYLILRRHKAIQRQHPSSPFLPLSAEDVAKGLRVAHPTLGYRHLVVC